jgi:hypothetical protein
MTRHINPIKMYEYLASGLPVVSTPLPEAERFGEAIRFAETPEEFASACDAAAAGESPDRRRAISKLVEGESWRAKVEELSALVMTRVSNKGIECLKANAACPEFDGLRRDVRPIVGMPAA